VTFGVNKLGLILYPGAEYAGEVIVGDIGFPHDSVDAIKTPYSYYEPSDIRDLLPKRRPRTHKGDYGYVLVIAGSESMCGAAYFSAAAAYRAGAGLVRVVSSPVNRDILLEKLPEILFSPYDELEDVIERADAIVIGPGLGLDGQSEELVKYVVENSPVPTVIDGDGIRLSRNITSKLSENFILTPHTKEMSYLTGRSVSELADSPVSTAFDTAMDMDCIIVNKDARTVVSDGNTCYINVSGNNGMATGGSGDVLSGIIGGLLAQGMEPYEAAKLAVYLHGLSGDVMAEQKSRYGLVASDLLDGLTQVLKEGVTGTRNGGYDAVR
jgi:NAD(P)H-hydrate epimerase